MDEEGLVIEDWGSFGGWQNFIGNFKPGKGYKVNVTTECTLTINAGSSKSDKIVQDFLKSGHFIHSYKGNGVDHMNINLINVADCGIKEGDELGVFDGNICVGSAQIANPLSQIQGSSISIPVSASDGIGANNGYMDGNTIGLKLFRDGVEYPLAIEPFNYGTPVFKRGSSLFAKVDIVTGLEELNPVCLAEIKCYPNPFSESVTIEFNLDTDAHVQVQVLNQSGQKVVVVSPKQIQFSGLHKFTWNGRNKNKNQLSPGIYYFRIEVDDSILHKKIVLSR